MKRLIKTKKDYSDFLISFLQYNDYNKATVDEIIQNNSDCLYNGPAYRVLYFYKTELEGKIDIEKAVYDLIESRSSYQSFSKTIDGVHSVSSLLETDEYLYEDQIKVIVNTQVNGALDIEKFVTKYQEDLSPETLDTYNFFEDQEEVLGKFTNDFTIVNLEEIKNNLS